ncbi:MAG: DUF11 domain-containing protein, partial [Anaerolineae bacterium]
NGSPIHPKLYAELYHHLYTTIKAADPTANVAVAAIVQPSPLRMEYLDNVLNRYQTLYGQPLPSDLWTIHLYRFNEGPCGFGWGAAVPPASSSQVGWYIADQDFDAAHLLDRAKIQASIADFRQWMYDRGYGDQPLIISEYGVLPPPAWYPTEFSNAVAAQYLDDMFTYLRTATDPTTGLAADGGRLVQMWAWFSTDHQPPTGYFKYGGDLFCSGYDNSTDPACLDPNNTDRLTTVGQAFVAQTTAHYTPYVDLQPVPPLSVDLTPTRLSVGAYLQNRGNISATNASVRLRLLDATGSPVVPDVVQSPGTLASRYAGSAAFITHTWRITFADMPTATRPYTPVISVESADDNPLNNTLTTGPLLDLAVTGLQLSIDLPYLYRRPITVVATTTVVNAGASTSPATEFQFTLQKIGSLTVESTPPQPVPPLQPGEWRVLTAGLPITQAGLFRLDALLPQPLGPLEVTANNRQTQTVPIIGPEELALTKRAPFIADPGQTVTYTLTLTNNSPVTLTNVVITDAVPAGATYIGGGTLAGGVVSWTVAALPGNGGVTQTTFAVSSGDMLINRDYGFTANGDVQLAGRNPVVTLIKGGTPPMSINKTGPTTSIPGALIPYTLTLTNNSPVTLTNVVITDAVPAGASYFGGGTLAGGVVSWTVASLPGSGGTAQVTFVVTAGQTITNRRYGAAIPEGIAVVGSEVVETRFGDVTPIDPGQGGTVIITDTFIMKTPQTLTVEIPADAITEALNVSYTRFPNPTPPVAWPGLSYKDLFFALDAYRGTALLPNLTLNRPLTITVLYTDTALMDESRLNLYYFNTNLAEWVEATTTCPPEDQYYSLITPTNRLAVTVCRLGQYSLLGEANVYLPLILKAPGQG